MDERKILYISQKYNYSNFLSKLIASLDILEEEIDGFLNPDITNDIPNPFNLKDMVKTISRTIQAIKKNEKIGILGDYDVDGSTSAAILCKFFKSINQKFLLKIPNRLKDGYGPNEEILDEFLDNKIDLLLTIDCGTTSFDIIDKDKYLIFDTIVIDHHISDKHLPKVFSIKLINSLDPLFGFGLKISQNKQ